MRALVILTVLLLAALPASAQTPTAEPIPLPTQAMFEALDDANGELATLPDDLTSPDGSPVLADGNGRIIMGYIKWFVNPASADEWAGPFAPIFMHLGIGLYMVFALFGVYGVVYVIANIGGWVGWLTYQFWHIINIITGMLSSAPMIIITIVILFIAFLLFTQPAVMDWIGQQFDSVLDWVFDIMSDILGGQL